MKAIADANVDADDDAEVDVVLACTKLLDDDTLYQDHCMNEVLT